MKLLFKIGKVDKNNKINFKSSDYGLDEAFLESTYEVISKISRYDVELYDVIDGKEIFYIYDLKSNKENIIRELDFIINDHVENILNSDDALILENVYNEEFVDSDTIFWDVMNDFIIVIGKNNLKVLAEFLEKLRWINYIKNIDDISLNKVIPESSKSRVLKKVNKL